MSMNGATINVYDLLYDNCLEVNVTIAHAITSCIPSVRIAKGDRLSKLICPECHEKISSYYNFRNTCIASDQKQRETIRLSEKRKIHETQMVQAKKFCPEDVKKSIQASKSPKPRKVEKKTEIDKKFEYVEAELMKALEGKLTDEMKSADNIIIQIQSDDENEIHEEQINTTVVKVGTDEVKLPKGIKVSVNQARIGVFEATQIDGDTSDLFCLVDEYVFEYRLCKGSVR